REVAAQVGHAPGQTVEHLVVHGKAGILDRLPGVCDELLGGPGLPRHADHPAGETATELQAVQGPEGLLPRQVPGDTEDHEYAAVGSVLRRVHVCLSAPAMTTADRSHRPRG